MVEIEGFEWGPGLEWLAGVDWWALLVLLALTSAATVAYVGRAKPKTYPVLGVLLTFAALMVGLMQVYETPWDFFMFWN